MKEFDVLKQLVTDAEADVAKVDAGNKSAGTRVRKSMQSIKKQCQVVRDTIISLRDAEDKADGATPVTQ